MSAPTPGVAARTLSDLLDDRHSWQDYTLFGESIPHLLHWDWAYMWVLGRYPKPSSWEPRIEAWRRLLCMLLLGELQLEAQPIKQPLLSYTKQGDLSEIVFLRSPEQFGEKPIGVFSSTALVRPLPEPNRFGVTASDLASLLPKHYDPPPGVRDRRSELRQMLDLTRGRISQLAGKSLQDSGSEYAKTLLDLIDTNLQITKFEPIAKTYDSAPLPHKLQLLARADASAWTGIELVDLALDASIGTGRPQFVPQCSQCSAPLTYTESDPPVLVATNVPLKCPVCGTLNSIELQDLGIWNDGNTTYVWRELDALEGLAQVPVPPTPAVFGSEIRFRWNSARTGDALRAHLRLHFPDRRLQEVRPTDIRYNSLLVPGEFGETRAYPIRPEWLFAVESIGEVEVVGDVIAYRNMRLRGLRHPVTLGRYPKSACRIVSELQVGMFPSPMYSEWKRYRFYCSGPSTSEYRACTVPNRNRPAVTSRKPAAILETMTGLPAAIAVEGNGPTDIPAAVGATWLLESPAQEEVTRAVYVGVDFGTTNTVVFADTLDGRPVFLERQDFVRAARVIAGTGDARAPFLPPPKGPRLDDTDESLIPSALWVSAGNEVNPIRWSSQPPLGGSRAIHGFKWGSDVGPNRKRYLEELLFLSLPTVGHRLFPADAAKANWSLGFAFPLAFSDPQRSEYGLLLNTLKQGISSYSSRPVEIRNVNESYACVSAFGTHLEGSVFLIADLGGGSLDVALFEIASSRGRPRPNYIQVGSAKIGGEAFVSALANQIGTDPESRNHHYWRIRDAITAGRVAQEFPGANFSGVATKFLPIAEEMLRVMVEALRKRDPNKEIKLVLVGNGWRIEEFTASIPLSMKAGRRDLEQTFERFEIPQLAVHQGQLPVAPKHVVAFGALSIAKMDTHMDEIGESANESKIPAGRNIKLLSSDQSIQWFELIGSALKNIPLGTVREHIDINRKSGPSISSRWQQNLDHALPHLDTEPSDSYVREKLVISGERLERGPLQVILEKRAEDLA